MEEQKFAIIQWIDKFTSIINLDGVKYPRKPLESYKAGEYVTALYGNKKFKARISEISGDKTYLAAKKTPNGNFPLNFVNEDQETVAVSQSGRNVKRTASDQASASDKNNERQTEKRPRREANDEVHSSDADSAASQVEQQPSEGAARSNVDSAIQDEQQPSDAATLSSDGMSPPLMQSPAPRTPTCTITTPVSFHSSKRKLEKRVDELEKRVDELEKELKELRGVVRGLGKKVKALQEKEIEGHPEATSAATGDARTGSDSTSQLEQLTASVVHLSGQTEKEANIVLRRVCLSVFSKEELVSSTRTGKKTSKAGETPKPALDSNKLQLAEKVILSKCPGVTVDI